MDDGSVIIGTKLETKSFDKQIEELERQLENIEEELSDPKKYKLDSRSIEEYKVKAEKLKNSIIGLQKQQLKLNENHFFENASNSISSLIKKTLKWGVALFGIRSAYSFISKSMSTLSQYNQQIGTDLSYIQFAMATALEPVIEVIIQLAYKLLGIINSISIALFNIDLFANASAKRFKSMSKSANQIKKSLAGFDEMNILQDNSASGGGGVGMPSDDFFKNKDKYKKIGENFKSYWKGIIQFWEHDWKKAFDNIGGMWGVFFKGVVLMGKGFYDTFKGIIDFVIGLFQVLIGAFTGNKELIDKGVENLAKGIKEVVIGLIELVVGLVMSLGGIIIGILVEVVGSIWNLIKGLVEGVWDILKFGVSIIWGVMTTIANILIAPFITMWDTAKGVFNGVKEAVTGVFKVIKGLFTGDMEMVLEGFKQSFRGVFNSLVSIAKAPLNLIINAINAMIKGLNKVGFDVPSWVPAIGGKRLRFNIPTIPRLAKGGIVNMPGRGVNYSGANIGERAPEGVIPLTDSQQMEWLGREIGKNVTINATIPVYAYNRQVDKQIRRIQAEDDFAFNR